MKRKLLHYSCRSAFFAAFCGLVSLSAPCAHSATISFTTSLVSPTTGDVGTSSSYEFKYNTTTVNSLSVSSGVVDLNGANALNFGSLTEDLAANPNVTPTFILGVTPTINSTPTSEIYFEGTINNATDMVDFSTCGTDSSCAHPSTSSIYDINPYPSVPAGYQQFVFENVGGYSFGIDEDLPLNTQGMIKVTNLFGFVAPASMTTPEPASIAMTALAICGLLGFGLRRKLQAIHS